jgi:hypothetical protein
MNQNSNVGNQFTQNTQTFSSQFPHQNSDTHYQGQRPYDFSFSSPNRQNFRSPQNRFNFRSSNQYSNRSQQEEIFIIRIIEEGDITISMFIEMVLVIFLIIKIIIFSLILIEILKMLDKDQAMVMLMKDVMIIDNRILMVIIFLRILVMMLFS